MLLTFTAWRYGMSLHKFNALLREYGIPGGIATLLATYLLFFTESFFSVPAFDLVLLEKVLVLLFGVTFFFVLYILRYFQRKPARRNR